MTDTMKAIPRPKPRAGTRAGTRAKPVPAAEAEHPETTALFAPAVRPASTEPAPIPAHVPTCSITCPVCNQRDTIAITQDARLCHDCMADLDGAARIVARNRDTTTAAFEAACNAFDRLYFASDATTRARYDALNTARHKVHQRLYTVQRGKVPAERVAALLAEAQAAVASFEAKYAKTLALGDALSALLTEEQRLERAKDDAARDGNHWIVAQQEIDAARDARAEPFLGGRE